MQWGNAGGQRGVAIPRGAGKRWEIGVGKPRAPDESKAEHIQAEHPPEAETAAVTRGLARRNPEGARPKKDNRHTLGLKFPG